MTFAGNFAPTSVTLTIERVEERAIPVRLHYENDRHYGPVVASATTVPQSVIARGATSDLARVDSVRVEVALPQGDSALDEMQRPIPVDARGAALDAVTVSPNLVRVRARLHSRPRWLAIAATILVMVGAGEAAWRQHEGYLAKEQVMTAMRIAGGKLNRVQLQLKGIEQ